MKLLKSKKDKEIPEGRETKQQEKKFGRKVAVFLPNAIKILGIALAIAAAIPIVVIAVELFLGVFLALMSLPQGFIVCGAIILLALSRLVLWAYDYFFDESWPP